MSKDEKTILPIADIIKLYDGKDTITELEKFIFENYQTMKDRKDTYDDKELEEIIYHDFKILCERLHKKNKHKFNSMALWFSLDKKLFPLIDWKGTRHFPKLKVPNTIKINTSWLSDHYFQPDLYVDYYRYGENESTNYFEENMEYFPSSTMKYFSNKQKEKVNSSEIPDNIKNHLEYKVFCLEIGLNPTLKKLNTILSKFKKTQSFHSFSSFYYYQKYLKHLSTYDDRPKIVEIINSLDVLLFNHFSGYIIDRGSDHYNFNGFKNAAEMVYDNNELWDKMLKFIEKEDHSSFRLFFFSLFFAKNQEQINLLNRKISEKLESETRFQTVEFEYMSEKDKEIMLNEAKRQFSIKNKELIFLKPKFIKNIY